MDNSTNLKSVQQVYQCFAKNDIPALMAFFDPGVQWIEPGQPDIPFAGVFQGMAGLGKMFALETANIHVNSFTPQSFAVTDNLVVVLGKDSVGVIPTGKSYATDWVQAFSFNSAGKIIRVEVYMDTLAIAKAFQP